MKSLSGLLGNLYGADRHERDGQVFYAGVRFKPESLEQLREGAPDVQDGTGPTGN